MTPEQVTSEGTHVFMQFIKLSSLFLCKYFGTIVPLEIRSRGEEAIHYFRAALQDGKTKPHRIKLMVLGDAEVGKTSLYRYLTGQPFVVKLERTEGIDTRLISTPEIDPVSDTVWKVMDSPQSEFSDKIAMETVKRVKNAEAASSRSDPLIQEIPEQTQVNVMASGSDWEHIPRRKLTIEKTQQSVEVSPVPQTSTVSAVVHKHTKTWKHMETSTTTWKQPTKTSSYHQPDAHYSGDSEDQSRYPHIVPRKRHYTENVGNDATASKPKPKKKKKKKGQKPELPQHDFSELPMKNIQKHWESGSTAHDDAKVKFSVWDFAGQPLYEPMHHTFLTRRALYIIVMNLAKLTDNGITELDLQRIYFWVASVHTHTSLKPEPVRVFFVGTHCESPGVTPDRIAKAVQQLHDCFQSSKNLPCHIEYVEHDDYDILTMVENASPDFEDRSICLFRNTLLKVALEQSYMKEEIPLIWLRYEDEILKFHVQSLGSQATVPSQQPCCLLTLQDMQDIATKCEITMTKGSFKTMITFFHDVGLVIYPCKFESLICNNVQVTVAIVCLSLHSCYTWAGFGAPTLS